MDSPFVLDGLGSVVNNAELGSTGTEIGKFVFHLPVRLTCFSAVEFVTPSVAVTRTTVPPLLQNRFACSSSYFFYASTLSGEMTKLGIMMFLRYEEYDFSGWRYIASRRTVVFRTLG